MTVSMQVEIDLREDLKTLKGIRPGLTNMTKVIRYLLEARGYNEEFFERIREKVDE